MKQFEFLVSEYIWLAWLFYFFVVSDVLLLRLFLLIYHVKRMHLCCIQWVLPLTLLHEGPPVFFCHIVASSNDKINYKQVNLWPLKVLLGSPPQQKKATLISAFELQFVNFKVSWPTAVFLKRWQHQSSHRNHRKKSFSSSTSTETVPPTQRVRTRCTNAEICSSYTQLDVTLSGRCWQDLKK